MRWLGAARDRLGQREAGHQLVLEALALFDDPALANLDMREEKAEALWELGYQLIGTDIEESRRRTETSLSLYQALGDRRGTALVQTSLGFREVRLGEYARAEERFRDSLAWSRSYGHQWSVTRSLYGLGVSALYRGNLEEAESLLQESITIRQGVGDRIGIQDSQNDLGKELLLASKFEEARGLLEESADCFADLGPTPYTGDSHTILALVEMSLGHYERARVEGETALALGRDASNLAMTALALHAVCCARLGRAECGLGTETASYPLDASGMPHAHAEAQRLADESVTICRQTGHRHDLAMCLATLGITAQKLRGLGAASQHLLEALQIGSAIGAFWPLMLALPGVALFVADAGEHERAVELYALASRYPYVANSRWFEDVFGRHIDAVAATLPPEVAEEARKRGRARDLQVTAKELLVELEGWQTTPSDSPQKDS